MKIFVVQNGDDVIMGIFKTKKRAKLCAKNVGKKRWNEHWSVMKIKLGEVDPTMLAGCQEYRMRKHKS